MQPRPYQSDAVTAAIEDFTGGTDAALVVLPTGCHHPDQGILMDDGTIQKASEVRVGDFLKGMDSKHRKVLAVHRGRDEMFRVIPTKGSPFIVNGSHILSLVRTAESSSPQYPCERRAGEIVDVTVREWMSWPKWRKHIHKLFRVPADFWAEAYSLDFDPYIAGVMLGDGSMIHGRFGVTTADKEIEAAIRDFAAKCECEVTESPAGGASKTYYLSSGRGSRYNQAIDAARSIGLYGMACGEKRIPYSIRTGTRHERLEVLAGLIDTDGSLTSGTCFDYISKSRQLSEDVAFVARSLGLAAYVSECRKSCQTGASDAYYRVSISGETWKVPCRIPRKQAFQRKAKKDPLRTGFTVEPVGVGEYVGFTVDGDNRYLLDDFTVTHNCGKTVVCGMYCREIRSLHRRTGKALFLAHRQKLIKQTHKTMRQMGLSCSVEMGSHKGHRSSDVVVGTVQTLTPERLESWPSDHFDTIIVDECHHVRARSYRRILSHFHGYWHYGTTATPGRSDGKNLGSVYQSEAYRLRFETAISDGWLCPVRPFAVPVQVDLREISTTRGPNGDLNAGDLSERIGPKVEELCDAIRREIGDRQTIVFCPDTGSAAAVSQVLCLMGVPSKYVSGSGGKFGMTRAESDAVLSEFDRLEFQVLVSCDMLTEGYDCPAIACVVILRPTLSRFRYSQMVGRGTRQCPWVGKDDCLILDFDWLTDDCHRDLCSPVTLYDDGTEDLDDDVYEAATKAVKEGNDVRQAIEDAKLSIKLRPKIDIKLQGVVAKYLKMKRDPNGVGKILGVPIQKSRDCNPARGGGPATQNQAWYLGSRGVENASSLSKFGASKLISEFKARETAGLGTVEQVRILISSGMPESQARTLPFEACRARVEELNRIGFPREMRA